MGLCAYSMLTSHACQCIRDASAPGPVHPDRVAPVPAGRRLAHRVEDAHPGRRRLGHLDHRARMTFIEEIDERPAWGVALLADLPAALQRALADLMVVLRPARPVLHPLVAGGEKVAVEARAVAALLDQLQLHVARIGQGHRHPDVVGPALVAELGQRQLLGVEPRTDAADLDPMAHRLLDVADRDPDLAHRSEQAAHDGSSLDLGPGTVSRTSPRGNPGAARLTDAPGCPT